VCRMCRVWRELKHGRGVVIAPDSVLQDQRVR
jgi:hypothetical protein